MLSSSHEQPPLARLVLFMVCLSLAGAFVAGAHYYVVDLPGQKALSLPPPANANGDTLEKCNSCRSPCSYLQTEEDYYKCLDNCELIC
jgi:hypothetical protein